MILAKFKFLIQFFVILWIFTPVSYNITRYTFSGKFLYNVPIDWTYPIPILRLTLGSSMVDPPVWYPM